MQVSLKNTFKRLLTSIIFILVSVWVLLSLILYVFQPKFVYYPTSEIHATPEQIGLEYEDVTLTTEDNVSINGWYIPAQESEKDSSKTLLFFHGNGGNLSHRLDSIRIFNQLGLSVFIIDYRGYGKSQGKPDEQGTYQDAKAAWQYLTDNKNINQKDIIIFGRSLGGAVASWLAKEHTPHLLILESTFTSIIDMGKVFYPYLPTSLITRIKYDSFSRINDISCPILIAHSKTDEIVPFELGQRLFEKAASSKQFLLLKGGHNDGFMITGTDYINGLKDFISSNH